jgi:ubiquitin-like protein Pup
MRLNRPVPQEAPMAGQEQQRPRDRKDAPEETAPEASASSQLDSDEVDAVLDEIDDVLESNVEEFVKGFVQKGGQ